MLLPSYPHGVGGIEGPTGDVMADVLIVCEDMSFLLRISRTSLHLVRCSQYKGEYLSGVSVEIRNVSLSGYVMDVTRR